MNSGKKGLIFDIERFSLQDGPGIRTTVFMKGCPLRCPWCHNPESQLPYPELLLDAERCNLCGKCLEVCSSGAIEISSGRMEISRERCDLCGKCAEVCPSNAVRICGKYMSVDEVVEMVLRDRDFYEFTGGGVTISGGEPLNQPDFLFELLKNLREREIDVCLDTSGFADDEAVMEAMKYVNTFLYDVKTLDPEKHLKLTGVQLEPILKNLELIIERRSQYGVDLIVRIPLIMGVNFSSPRELTETIKLLSRKGIKQFELIPYHRFGEKKYRFLGREYNLSIKPLDMEEINTLVKNLEKTLEIEVRILKPIIL